MYKYPSFIQGEVYFKNGKTGYGYLNYNFLFGEIEYIKKNDTLALADEATIEFVSISSDTFFFHDGFIESIYENNGIRVAKRKQFRFVNREKVGAFGQKSQASVETYTTLSAGHINRNLVAQEILSFALDSTYFVADRFNQFKPANKKNLMYIFQKQQQKLREYLEKENIDFKNEEHLRKVMQYMQ